MYTHRSQQRSPSRPLLPTRFGTALLLLYASFAGAATAPATASTDPINSQTPTIPYQFCESGNVPNGTAYVSPVFEDPLRDVRTEYSNYLAATEGYRGQVKCYALPSRASAQSFRTQRIELLHWNDAMNVVATQWSPPPGTNAPSFLAKAGESAPATRRSPE